MIQRRRRIDQLPLADSDGPLLPLHFGELPTEQTLVSAAIALGAEAVSGWSLAEGKLAQRASQLPRSVVDSREA
jgi:hypothetical protein